MNTITFGTVAFTGVEMETHAPDAALGAAMLVGGLALTAIALRHARTSIDQTRNGVPQSIG
jgi:hypothetical protein